VQRRAPRLLGVVVDDRLRLVVEGGEALLKRLGVVVLPARERLAGDVVDARRLGRVELLVVRAARRRVDQPAADALDERLVGDLELNNVVDLADALRGTGEPWALG